MFRFGTQIDTLGLIFGVQIRRSRPCVGTVSMTCRSAVISFVFVLPSEIAPDQVCSARTAPPGQFKEIVIRSLQAAATQKGRNNQGRLDEPQILRARPQPEKSPAGVPLSATINKSISRAYLSWRPIIAIELSGHDNPKNNCSGPCRFCSRPTYRPTTGPSIPNVCNQLPKTYQALLPNMLTSAPAASARK